VATTAKTDDDDDPSQRQNIKLTRTSLRVSRLASLASSLGVFLGLNQLVMIILALCVTVEIFEVDGYTDNGDGGDGGREKRKSDEKIDFDKSCTAGTGRVELV
jgi:hypothetical protein